MLKEAEQSLKQNTISSDVDAKSHENYPSIGHKRNTSSNNYLMFVPESSNNENTPISTPPPLKKHSTGLEKSNASKTERLGKQKRDKEEAIMAFSNPNRSRVGGKNQSMSINKSQTRKELEASIRKVKQFGNQNYS